MAGEGIVALASVALVLVEVLVLVELSEQATSKLSPAAAAREREEIMGTPRRKN
jgi:hypothetical protein